MKKTKTGKCNVPLLIVTLLTIGIIVGGLTSSVYAKPIVIKIGGSQPEGHYLVQYVYKSWCDELAKRTNNEVQCKWFHANSLIGFKENVEALKKGLVEMVECMGFFYHESQFVATAALHLPFLYTSTAQADHVYQEAYETIPEIREEHKGIKMLGFHMSDLSNFHWRRGLKPVTSVADLKGRRVMSNNKVALDILKRLGASPRLLDVNDMYMALQRKSIDGVLFPTGPLAAGFKLDEVTDNHTLVFMSNLTIAGGMNQEFYDKLPPDVKKVIDDMVPSWTRFAGAIVDNRRESTLRALKERGDYIYEFTPEQRTELKKSVQPFYDDWKAKARAKGLDADRILNQIERLAKKYEGISYPDDSWWPKDWRR
jgi:TRAP-type C4-dicarboxylate transport system substrate-binding protein